MFQKVETHVGAVRGRWFQPRPVVSDGPSASGQGRAWLQLPSGAVSVSTPRVLGHPLARRPVFWGGHLFQLWTGGDAPRGRVRQTWGRRMRGPQPPHSGESGGAVFDFQGKKLHRGRSRALVVYNISSKNAISGLITKTRLSFPGSWRTRSDHRAYCAPRRWAVRTPQSSPF